LGTATRRFRFTENFLHRGFLGSPPRPKFVAEYSKMTSFWVLDKLSYFYPLTRSPPGLGAPLAGDGTMGEDSPPSLPHHEVGYRERIVRVSAPALDSKIRGRSMFIDKADCPWHGTGASGRRAAGERLFANPRNAAAGRAGRQIDPRVTATRRPAVAVRLRRRGEGPASPVARNALGAISVNLRPGGTSPSIRCHGPCDVMRRRPRVPGTEIWLLQRSEAEEYDTERVVLQDGQRSRSATTTRFVGAERQTVGRIAWKFPARQANERAAGTSAFRLGRTGAADPGR